MALEQFKNNSENTLDGGIDNSQTTLDVVDASVFPSSPQFRIGIDDEIMLVTGISSNTLTVTRGVENTTPAIHLNGADVVHVLTKGALDKRNEDYVLEDTIANRPNVGRAGALFIPASGVYAQRDTGAAWESFGPIYRIGSQPPTVSGFSWVNQETAVAADEAGTILLTDPAHNGLDTRLLVKSAPSTPYVITAAFLPMLDHGTNSSGSPSFGLCFRESSSGELKTVGLAFSGSTSYASQTVPWASTVNHLASPTSFTAQHFSRRCLVNMMPVFLRISDDGVDRKYLVSSDGLSWGEIYTEGRTTDMTANEIGWFLNNNVAAGSTAFDSRVRLISWNEE